MAVALKDRIVHVDRWPVHLRLGDAGAADVVLLHGIPGSGRSWDGVLANWPDGLRPIVPDLLGFGGSGRPTDLETLHAAGQARYLGQALDGCGVQRPILVGHDFGGPVALHLLMRAPRRYAGLVLAATNTFGDTPIPFPLSLLTARPLEGLVARLLFSRPALAGMCRLGARAGRVDVAAGLGDAQQSAAIAAIFRASLTRLAELYGPIERSLPALTLPTLVLWGDRDPFFSVAQGVRTAEAIPGARLQVLPGLGHFLPEEAPERVAALIGSFARSILPSDSIRARSGVR